MSNYTIREVIAKLPRLFAGFFLAALGMVLMLRADLGMNPWGTFTAGLVEVTGLPFGRLSQIIGLVIILMTLFFRVIPGVGTLFNMYFIGYFIDLIIATRIITTPDLFLLQLAMSLVGLVVFSLGVYYYLSCGLGAGPRDGLMLTLMRLTGKSTFVIRTAIEMTVMLVGLLLGGPLGISTVLIAIGGGRVLQWVFTLYHYDPTAVSQHSVVSLMRALRQPR